MHEQKFVERICTKKRRLLFSVLVLCNRLASPIGRMASRQMQTKGVFLQGTVLNMAELHRGYSGAWLAEHHRRPLALRVV